MWDHCYVPLVVLLCLSTVLRTTFLSFLELGVAGYVKRFSVWNVWNERKRRIFQGISQPPIRVLSLIKEEMKIRQQACEGRVLT